MLPEAVPDESEEKEAPPFLIRYIQGLRGCPMVLVMNRALGGFDNVDACSARWNAVRSLATRVWRSESRTSPRMRTLRRPCGSSKRAAR